MEINPFSSDISYGNDVVNDTPCDTPCEDSINEAPSPDEVPSSDIDQEMDQDIGAKEEETGIFGELYPTVKEWNKKVREVGKTYKLSPEQVNGLIMGIAASVAGATIPGYYKQTLHEKILHDMGYNRTTLKRMQDLKGGLPPWYKALEIDPRNPEFDILNKVKAGLSVNEAWKARRKAKYGEFYHKDKGWY